MDLFKINSFNKYEKYVYHYTTISKAFEYILDTDQLRFSPLKNLNDPGEKHKYPSSIMYSFWGEKDNKKYTLDDVKKDFNYFITNYSKVLCMTIDKKNHENSSENEKIYERGFSKSRMWEQYAGNHTGVCLIFNKTFLNKTITDYFKNHPTLSGEVEYKNKPTEAMKKFSLNIDLNKINSSKKFFRYLKTHYIDVENYSNNYYFRKFTDWKNENEYRWIIINEDNNDYDYVNFNDSLAGIVVGNDFPSNYMCLLEKAIAKYNIEVYKIKISNLTISIKKYI
jgi:hypothetical protein